MPRPLADLRTIRSTPSRRRWMLSLGLAVVLIVPSTSMGAASPRRLTSRPDIVVILTDDQRWDTLWAMPNVQALLVANGVTFSEAFAVDSLCCPSRASILSGQYAHTTGVYSNVNGFQKFDDTSTVATWLHDAGYRTGLVGKYLNGYDETRTAYIPPGWDRWVAFTSQTGQGQYYDYTLSVNGIERAYGSDPEDYSTDVLATKAVDFILSTPPSRRLFLTYDPKAPHLPATPAARHANAFSDLPPWRPDSYNEADVSDKPSWAQALPPMSAEDQADVDFERLSMYRSLLAVDDAVGAIVSALESSGRLSTTLIVFASDNGFLWGEHRWAGKKVAYEESIRIPMVVRYDPLVPAPRVDGRFALNIDLAPTFAAAAGVPAPGAEGTSLLPLLSGTAVPWRKDFLIENALNSGGADEVPTFCAVRNRRFLYARYLATGEEELYDLEEDVGQLDSVSGDPGYAAKLLTLRARSGVLCVPPPPLSVPGQPGD